MIAKFHASLPQVLPSSIPFRGCYRWSVFYTEKLLEKLFRDRATTGRNNDEVAEEERVLQAPIKRRLQDLTKLPEKTSMLKDVFNMAFDADLLGRSRITSSESSSELIEQALGYVESAESKGVQAVKVSIAERLVVESVMENSDEKNQLGLFINEYLYANQFHEAAFGDAAEVGLAVAVSNLGSYTLPQREDFLSLLDTVYKISAEGCLFIFNIDLANFFLDKGDGLAADYMPPDGSNLGCDNGFSWSVRML